MNRRFFVLWLTIFSAPAVLIAPLSAQESPSNDQLELLWPKGAPQSKGDDPVDQPALTVHLPPQEKANGAAVIVNPGGGYFVLAADHEGLQMARALNRMGVTAFVLRYRLRPRYQPSTALLDGERAVRYVRRHAKRFQIDPARIGMLGFSAGGHLASAVGTGFDDGDSKSEDPVERESCRPDFLMLIYPAISKELFQNRTIEWPSTHKKVTAQTPPTFLVHTHEDFLSPNHSIAFYQALLASKVPAELHVFGHGPHGTGLAPGDPDLGQWPKLLQRWLRRRGLLTDQPRIEITGTVTLDGKPLYWGWVTFIPQNDNFPIVSAYLERDKKGKFVIDAQHGPCLGEHRVEVHLVSTDFSKPKTGRYSMPDARVFRTQKPGGKPLMVEITSSNRSELSIDVSSK